jgi:hypothetical protein
MAGAMTAAMRAGERMILLMCKPEGVPEGGRGSAAPNAVRCPFCGYCLVGLREPRCPECGSAFDGEELARAFSEWPIAAPWDDRRLTLIVRALWTAQRVLTTPSAFVHGFPTFYEPGRAHGFWALVALSAGALHVCRFLCVMTRGHVNVGVALLVGAFAASLLLLLAWVTETCLSHLLASILSEVAHAKSYSWWRGVTRYGVLFFLLSAVFFMCREGFRVSNTSGSPHSGEYYAVYLSTMALYGKIVILLWWWLYLFRAIQASGVHSRLRILSAVTAVVFLTVCATVVFGVVGGTIRFLT